MTDTEIVARVDRTGGPDACWPWTGYQEKHSGYGVCCVLENGKLVNRKAHRIVYQILKGVVLPKTMLVLHNCPGGDNPLCCNPRHLYEGTHARNMRDASEKGQLRPRRGEDNGRAVMTWPRVRRLRRMAASGQYTHKELGQRFGISDVMAGLIVRGKFWKEDEGGA